MSDDIPANGSRLIRRCVWCEIMCAWPGRPLHEAWQKVGEYHLCYGQYTMLTVNDDGEVMCGSRYFPSGNVEYIRELDLARGVTPERYAKAPEKKAKKRKEQHPETAART